MTAEKRKLGRPPGTGYAERSHRVEIALRPDAYQAIKMAAKAAGVPLASWIKRAAIEAARGSSKKVPT